MTCLEFFAQYGQAPQVCPELRKLPLQNLVDWEKERASADSPGPVQSGEILCRQIFIPHQYDSAKNCPKPDAYNDASTFGLSVNRLEHASKNEIVERGRAKAAADNQEPAKVKNGLRELKGVCTFEVDALKALLSTSERLRTFMVYDTARNDDISHADIFYVGDPQKAVWRSMRSHLYDMGVESFNTVQD